MADETVTRCFCSECRGKPHVTKRCRRRDVPHPDDPVRDLTGRYEEDQRYPQFTCQINQAGLHVEGWLQIAHVASAGQRAGTLPREQYTFAGDLPDRYARSVDLVVFDDWTRYRDAAVGNGRLSWTGAGVALAVRVRYASASHAVDFHSRLRPYPIGTTVPRLSNTAIAILPPRVREDLAAIETAPLPSPYLRELREWFSPDHIRKLVLLWRECENTLPTSQAGGVRRDLMDTFHRYVEKFIVRFRPDVVPVIRWHVRSHLSRYVLTEGASRSLLQDLEIAVTRTPASEGRYPLFGEQGLRLVRTDLGDVEHRYVADLVLVTASLPVRTPLGVGGAYGTLTVRQVLPKAGAWSATYDIDLPIGGSGGVGGGTTTTVRSTGTAVGYADWRPDNLCGSAVLIDASLWGALGPGRSWGSTVLRVHGDSTWAALEFDFSGWSVITGLGGGIGGSAYYGWISRPGARRPPRPKAEEPSFPVGSRGSAETHFALGCALLEPDGRRAIRRLCAQELYFLRSPSSALQIDGHTDRVDCARRNRELSALRAENVGQAVRDTMGGMLPRGLKFWFNAYGEEHARSAGLADGTEDRSWRKVEVFLNGRAVARLREGR